MSRSCPQLMLRAVTDQRWRRSSGSRIDGTLSGALQPRAAAAVDTAASGVRSGRFDAVFFTERFYGDTSQSECIGRKHGVRCCEQFSRRTDVPQPLGVEPGSHARMARAGSTSSSRWQQHALFAVDSSEAVRHVAISDYTCVLSR